MALIVTPTMFAQPDTVTFNVNETLPKNPGPGYTVSKRGASVVVTSGGATVTFTAPSGAFSGKELPNSLGGQPAFFLDNPATFTISATFSSPDDAIVLALNGYGKGGTPLDCSTNLTPKKLSTTCAYQAFAITAPSDRKETGNLPRLLQQSFRADFNSGIGPSALVYAEYDYDNGNTCPAPFGNSTVAARDASTCNDLAIDSIQFVQNVQNPSNDARLAAGLDTIVRVFVKSVGANAVELDKIAGKVQINGQPYFVEGPLTRAFPNSIVLTTSGRTIVPDSSSFDVVLGRLNAGPLDVQADVWIVGPDGNPLTEGDDANNHMSASVKVDDSFVDAVFHVGYGLACIRGASQVVTCGPAHREDYHRISLGNVHEQWVLLPKLIFEEALLNTPDGQAFVFLNLIREYQWAAYLTGVFNISSAPQPDQIVFVVGTGDIGSLKSADALFGQPNGAGDYWWVQGCSGDSCDLNNAILHGIAHNFGLSHFDLGAGQANPLAPGKDEVAPREELDIVAGPWRFLDDTFMDTRYATGKPFRFPGISIGESNALHRAFIGEAPAVSAAPATNGLAANPIGARSAASREIAIVSGSVGADGSSGSLDPTLHAQSNLATRPSNPNSDTCLRFSSAGNTTGDYCFKVIFATGASKGYFSVAVPLPTGTDRIAFRKGGRELASVASGVPPQVSFQSPKQGETWAGVNTIRWSATGTGLLFRLEYSADNGATWLPLSGALTATQYDVSASDLLGGSVVFRVTAASGLDSAQAVSPAVQVPSSPQLTLSATSLNFKNLTIGDSDTQHIDVSNTGTGQLMVKITAPANPAFTLVSNTVLIIPSGGLQTVGVRFKPAGSGSQQGTMVIGSHTVNLTGSGFSVSVPNISLPSLIDLGDVQSGETKQATFTISNTGSAALVVGSASMTGSGFSLVNASLPFTITSGQSAQVTAKIIGGSAGTQQGQVTIGSNDPARAQIQIPVTVRVVSGSRPSSIAAGVVNAASYQGGAVAPGEIVSIFGSGFGPPAIAALQLDASGRVTTLTGETMVFFDEFPAPIIYSVAGQASVIVPYGIEGRGATQMVIQYQGRRSDPVQLLVADAVPALFSANASGTGQGAILNQDSRVNSAQNPADKGSIVVLFGTGEGASSPFAADGQLANTVFPKPLLPVSATIGGLAADVLYAGAAPGLVAGVLQVNLRLPPAVSSGNQPVVIKVGSQTSQSGLTVAIAGAAPTSPAIAVTAPTLDFGSVNTGSKNDITVTVSNTGSATLSVTPTFAPNPPFSIVSPGGSLSVNAGTAQTLTLRFSPAVSGAQNAILTLVSNDPAHPSTTLQFKGTGVTSSACFNQPPNLVSWWAGDGNASDLLGASNLTLLGGAAFGAGEVGQAFQFDGNNGYASAGNPASLLFTSAMTMEAWINPKAAPPASGGSNMAAVVTKWGQKFDATPDSDSYGLWLRNDNGSLSMFSAIHTSGTNEPNIKGGSVPLNAWSHVAMTFDSTSGNFVLYVNGQALASLNTPGPIMATTRNVFVGREDSSLPRPFNGLVDEVSMYNRALTAAEIQAIFNAGANGKCKPGGSGGGTPTISVTAPNLDFGTANTGSTKDLTLTIANTGTATLSVTPGFTPNPPFSIVSPAGSLSVNAGTSQTMTVRFSPTTSGAQTGTLTLTSSDQAHPTTTLQFKGTGVVATPTISVTAPDLDFGTVNTGSTKDLTLTIANTGTATLSVTPSFAPNPPFSIVSPAGSLSVNAGTSQTMTVRFSPITSGAQTGTLTLTSSDQAHPTTTLQFKGTGVVATPTISVTAPNLDFGTVNTGSTKDLTLTIANTGTATLSVTPTFAPNPPFSIVSPAGSLSVNAGTSQTMTVRFSPITSGAQTGTLTLTSSDQAHPTTTLQFKGTGAGGGSPTCLAVPATLVSWWNGDGNSNDSTGGVNGTLQGGASFSAGEVGQAFQFDGSTGFVFLGNPAKLQFTSAMTIEAWINPKAGAVGSGNMAAVLSKWGQQFNPTSDTDSYGLWLRTNGTALTMFTAIHQAGTSEPNIQGGSIALNTWTHVAMTFDAASGRFVLYVNGQAVASALSPGAILTSTRNALIGREDSSAPRPFNGLIDEVSVYSRELSALEIQSIFVAGAAGKCKSGSGGGGGTGGGGGSGNGPNRPSGAVVDTASSLAPSLVGLFLMNERSGTTDKNISDNQNATFAGTNPPTWNATDPSIVFNGGSSYLNAGTDLAFDKLTVSKMTIVGRVFLNSGAAGGIAEKNDGNSIDSGFAFGFDGSGGLHFIIEQSGSNMRVNSNAAVIPTGQWVQVAVTWDGSVSPVAANAHLYLNGVELAKSQNSTGSGTLGFANATNRPFLIGNASIDFPGSLNGKMEYLAVYKGRILSPAELLQLEVALPIK